MLCCLSLPSLSHGTLVFVSVEYQGRWLLDWLFQDIFPIDFYRSPCQRELARVGVGWRGEGCYVRHASLSISKIYTEQFAAECRSACDFLRYRSMQWVRCRGTRFESCLFLIGQRALPKDRGCWKEEAGVCYCVIAQRVKGRCESARLGGTAGQCKPWWLAHCSLPWLTLCLTKSETAGSNWA